MRNKNQKHTQMKYLITGDLSKYSWTEARRKILLNLGNNVYSVDENKYVNFFGKRVANLQAKMGMGLGVTAYNMALRKAAIIHRPDVIWVDKGVFLQPNTIKYIKQRTNAIFINFNTDYLSNRKNPLRLQINCLKYYDYYFTSNKFDVEYLYDVGIKNVIVLPLGYYSELFKNLPELTSEEKSTMSCDVGFIGHWEPATEDLLLKLIEAGLNLKIRGMNWHKARNRDRLADVVIRGFVPPEDFIKCIMTTKINLGINSTINRNQTSGRSYEIPAAGGFLLAKRTDEHAAMYAEGIEAEFFDNADDIVTKVKFYLNNEERRKEVAANGRMRCIASGSSFEEIMIKITNLLEAYHLNRQ